MERVLWCLASTEPSVGFGFKIGDWFRLMPEVSALVPLVSNFQPSTPPPAGGVLYEVGLGGMFGAI